MNNPRLVVVAGIAAVFVCCSAAFPRAQEPTPPPPQAPAASSTSAPAKPEKQKYSHANDFLIIGTVFDPKGYAFPGAELRIRRSNEKKYRWDGFTNSRGEFAVRVPQGSDYEMVVRAKGFADQTRPLDAKTGVSEARIVFRMEPAGGREEMNAPARFCALAVILLSASMTAVAQDAKREGQLRTVHGIVQDKSEDLVSESVVFLKNARTNVVRSSYTDNTGKYRFSGLDPNTDYEIYAEKEGSKSATHTITSFDSRKDITLNLKIDKKKD